MTRLLAGIVALMVLAVPPAPAEEFSNHPKQPDGAKAAMEAVVEACLQRADRLAFDAAYASGLRIQVQNLLRIYDATDAAGLANRQARSLIMAICDTLEQVVPSLEAKSWWDFLKD